MHPLVLLALALVPVTTLAQEPVSLESVAAGYFGAETYCETAIWGTRQDPARDFSSAPLFSRCAHRDGRFKVVFPHKEVLWSDGKKYYRHNDAANFYREIPLDDDFLRSFDGNRGEVYPVYFSRLLNRYSPNAPDRASTSYFRTYKLSRALSTSVHSVFERHDDENHTNSERLWVRNADKAIVRYEGLRNGAILHFVEVTSMEVNRPLTDADLTHRTPPFTRFSLANNPVVFIAGLFAAAAIAAALFWGRLITRAAGQDGIARTRRRLWRAQFWMLRGIAIVLPLLAVLAIIIPGKGHPPGLWLVIVLAMWCAVGFALAATFTLMSHPVEWLFSRSARDAAKR